MVYTTFDTAKYVQANKGASELQTTFETSESAIYILDNFNWQ